MMKVLSTNNYNEDHVNRAVAKGCRLGGVLNVELPSKDNVICRNFSKVSKILLTLTISVYVNSW